jgi:pimeloyl-ACP methyl ester carboxylesterase
MVEPGATPPRIQHKLEVARVDLDHGPLTYARVTGASGTPVALLHQTPRSWDEYRDVLPLLAERKLAPIAFDTPGFGGSAPVPGTPTIERWADAMGAALDALAVRRAVVVGHHTGGAIAVELAAQRPDRISGLVLSSTSLTDAAYREHPPDESAVDAAQDAEGLRRSRAGFYPEGRSDLLDRYVADALRAGRLTQLAHQVVGGYAMEHRIARLTMPVLLIGADRDPFAYPELERMRHAIPGAEVAVVVGGMVPLPDGWPTEFARLVANFAVSTT